MSQVKTYSTASRGLDNATQKVLRNTYFLLGLTLLASAFTATVSTVIGVGWGMAMVMNLIALGLVWFVLPKTANSAAGLGVVFAFTMLLGASLGPTLNHYLATANGGQLVMQALGTTALVFFGLSAFVLTTRKDFSFMGGFLMVGLIVVLVSMLALLVMSFFGIQFSGVYLALNAAIVLLMSGFILFETSRIVNGGETNYILATTGLYLSIYNLFTALLHLLGMSED